MKEEPRARICCHPVSGLTSLLPQALTFSLRSSSALPNPSLSILPQMSPFGLFFLLRGLCLCLGDISLSFHRDCYENRSENNSRASGQAVLKSRRIIWPRGAQREPPGRGGERPSGGNPAGSSTAESQGRRPSLRETPPTESFAFNWRITALRYCVGFAIQCESAASTHTCPLLPRPLPHTIPPF